jgi:hypothetical protein
MKNRHFLSNRLTSAVGCVNIKGTKASKKHNMMIEAHIVTLQGLGDRRQRPPVRAQRAEVWHQRLVPCWFTRFKAVELSSELTENYLYVGTVQHCLYYSTTAAGFQPVFLFSFVFSQKKVRITSYEQAEEKHFHGRCYRADHPLQGWQAGLQEP